MRQVLTIAEQDLDDNDDETSRKINSKFSIAYASFTMLFSRYAVYLCSTGLPYCEVELS